MGGRARTVMTGRQSWSGGAKAEGPKWRSRGNRVRAAEWQKWYDGGSAAVVDLRVETRCWGQSHESGTAEAETERQDNRGGATEAEQQRQ